MKIKTEHNRLPDQGEITKTYYSIGEVSAMLNLNASLIRFWEKEFEQLKPKKSRHGERLFTRQDIDFLTVVYRLVKEKGYTLQGARDHLEKNERLEAEKRRMIKSLTHIRDFLTSLKT